MLAAVGAASVIISAYAVLTPIQAGSESVRDVHFEAASLSEQMTSRAQEAGRLATIYVISGQYEDQIAFEAAATRFDRAVTDYGDSPGSIGQSESASLERIRAAWAEVACRGSGTNVRTHRRPRPDARSAGRARGE